MIGWAVGLAAVSLLAYETWKRFSNASSPKPPGGAPAPSAAPSGSFENPPKFLASPMRMLQGQRYRFWFHDGVFEPSALLTSPKVYSSSADLPSDWPNDMRSPQGSTTKMGAGAWSKATGEIDRPDGLLQIWPTMSAL